MGKDASDIGPEVTSGKRRRQRADQVREQVVEGIKNPLGMAIGAMAVGFLMGLIIPVTPIEESALPQVREKLDEQIKAMDLMERAGRVLDETKRAAAQAVQEEARQASEALSTRSEQA
ncbi:MAG: hypothetical protein ACRENA_03880 [Vulcanimicrobiaceae bacterium]